MTTELEPMSLRDTNNMFDRFDEDLIVEDYSATKQAFSLGSKLMKIIGGVLILALPLLIVIAGGLVSYIPSMSTGVVYRVSFAGGEPDPGDQVIIAKHYDTGFVNNVKAVFDTPPSWRKAVVVAGENATITLSENMAKVKTQYEKEFDIPIRVSGYEKTPSGKALVQVGDSLELVDLDNIVGKTFSIGG